MGADTKKLRIRIKSVNSTLHLTKAMGLVASSKLRKSGIAMQNSKQYSCALEDMISSLTSSAECRNSPYLKDNGANALKLIVIAGDRGLAGGYNANIFRLCKEYENAEIIPIGKRACDKFGKETVMCEGYSFEAAKELTDKLCEQYLNGEFSKLGIVYTEYESMLSQTAKIEFLLPLEKSEQKQSAGTVFEPDELTMLNRIVKEYISGIILARARESFACEVAARRAAMDSAGKNAQQMIDGLKLKYNRARQGAITQEITEIVAGSGDL